MNSRNSSHSGSPTLNQALRESKFLGQYSSEVFDTLKQAYRPFWVWMILGSVIGFLGRGAILFSANYIGAWVDDLCQSPECKAAPPWFPKLEAPEHLWVLTGFLIFGFLGIWIFRLVFSNISAKAVSCIYDEVTVRTSRFPMSFFDTTPSGKVLTRFSSDYGNVFRLFGGPLAEFLSIVFDLIWVIFLISFASTWFIPLVLLAVLGNFLIYRAHLPKLRELRRGLSAKRSPSISHFNETVLGLPVIRLFSRESNFSERFYQLESKYFDERLSLAKNIFFFVTRMNLLTALFLLGVGLLAWASAVNSPLLAGAGISLGAAGASFALIIYSGHLVQMFFDWLSQFEEALVGVERLNEYLRSPLEKGASLPASTLFKTNHPVTPQQSSPQEASRSGSFSPDKIHFLKLHQVSLKYSEAGPLILKKIDLQFYPGKKYGIVGRTGSGKSSLVQVLMGLYPATEGSISYGDHLLFSESLSLDNYRKLFSYVSQDPFLFSGTLAENLTLGQKISDQKLLDVLKEMGWSSSPNAEDLQLIIEEKGKNLSAGEKQMVSLARCLLSPKPILILDEATSAIDPEHEELVYRILRRQMSDKILITIAHKIHQLNDFDQIIWLDHGQIRKIAGPAEVLTEFSQADLSVPTTL